eukprot:TRINITY_DN2316_c0_g1_i1.p1 TRINITY_DN2316_c0_g1~~TRINITY_DN2316_c0_g1_i1.p1  ORF type:complete len:248 (+),score=48.37 TRINITY_DN2316_c0_g1_i1:72-815(+)
MQTLRLFSSSGVREVAIVPTDEQSCCPPGSLPPLKQKQIISYQSKGVEQTLEDLKVYLSGQGNNRAVVVGYDIFGWHTGRMRKWCDDIASKGFLVILPDFFRGQAWDPEDVPFSDVQKFQAWKNSVATPAQVKVDVFEKVVPFLKAQGVGKIGMIGFCWGGKMTILCGSDSRIACGVGLHASQLQPEDAEHVVCPMMFLQGSNDPPIQPIKEILEKKTFGKECVCMHFDQLHGFCIRGDLSFASSGC